MEHSLTDELRTHIDSLTLLDAEKQLTELRKEMKREGSNKSFYVQELGYLRNHIQLHSNEVRNLSYCNPTIEDVLAIVVNLDGSVSLEIGKGDKWHTHKNIASIWNRINEVNRTITDERFKVKVTDLYENLL